MEDLHLNLVTGSGSGSSGLRSMGPGTAFTDVDQPQQAGIQSRAGHRLLKQALVGSQVTTGHNNAFQVFSPDDCLQTFAAIGRAPIGRVLDTDHGR